MTNAHLDNVIPDGRVRKNIYRVFAAIGLGIGAVQAGFAAANAGQPLWLTVALSVYAFLGGAGFYVSQANTPTARISEEAYREALAYDADTARAERGE